MSEPLAANESVLYERRGDSVNKPKLAISFSGGRTSAYMTKLCLEQYSNTHEIAVTFANTGQEHEKTLEFVKRCDDYFRFGTVWVEAVINQTIGEGTRHRIVTFETASRKGEPFEAMIAKYGLPGPAFGHCTRELKDRAIKSYLRSIGWCAGSYDLAIGIRSDEADRIPDNKREFIYPLVGINIKKKDVLRFWKDQPFDLELEGEHYGNCVWCWKKSDRKLMTLAKNSPEVFDFPARMEKLYEYKSSQSTGEPRRMFRKHKTVAEIFALSKLPFEEYKDSAPPDAWSGYYQMDLDIGSGCSESCEIGADEN